MKPQLPTSLESRLEGFSFFEVKFGMSGAQVFKLEKPGHEPLFLKIAPVDGAGVSGAVLRDAAERLAWANSRRLPVAKLEAFFAQDGMEYLLMRALPGQDASVAWSSDQVTTVIVSIARSLRFWHDTPASDCPFRYPLMQQIADMRQRWAHNPKAMLELEELLNHAPAVEDLVLCQGDPGSSNSLIGPDLEVAGWVDLDGMNLMDRHLDLALATISFEREVNRQFRPHIELFLEAYGLDVIDRDALDFYRRFDWFFSSKA